MYKIDMVSFQVAAAGGGGTSPLECMTPPHPVPTVVYMDLCVSPFFFASHLSQVFRTKSYMEVVANCHCQLH